MKAIWTVLKSLSRSILWTVSFLIPCMGSEYFKWIYIGFIDRRLFQWHHGGIYPNIVRMWHHIEKFREVSEKEKILTAFGKAPDTRTNKSRFCIGCIMGKT